MSSQDASRADAELATAVDRLRRGGVLAYPTETVWGLGVCADQAAAVDRLVRWKGRGENAPLAVLVRGADALGDVGCRPTALAQRLAEAFWPGPLMLVLPCDRDYPDGVAGRAGALGVRCSPHPVAATLAAALADAGLGPLTSTSLNRTGEPPARTRAEALAALDEEPAPSSLDAPFFFAPHAAEAGGQAPSTVVDCTGDEPVVLREGAIPVARIEALCDRPGTR